MDSFLLNSLHPDHTFFLWAASIVLQSMSYHCNRMLILAVETWIKWGNADLGPSSRPSPPSLKSCPNLALMSAIAFHPLYYGVTKTQCGDQTRCHPRNTQYIMFQIIGHSANIQYDCRDHHILSTVKFHTRSDAVPSPLKTRIKVTLVTSSQENAPTTKCWIMWISSSAFIAKRWVTFQLLKLCHQGIMLLLCMKWDNWRCVITGTIDHSAPKHIIAQLDLRTIRVNTQCAHIISEATYLVWNLRKSKENTKVHGHRCLH